MNTENDTSGRPALTIKQTALALGLPEFSVFARIQMGEINATRFPSGIVAVPIYELERLSKSSGHNLSIPPNAPAEIPSDNVLGISRDFGAGLMRQGERLEYNVPDHFRRFTETEIQGYRAAFGSIWEKHFELNRIRMQLEGGPTIPPELGIASSAMDGWQVCSTLLNLGKSDILLCQKQDLFAVIEYFQEGSPYVRANGQTEILLEGNDARELAAAFDANARHTLEFMASNQMATAQKVIWEHFSDHRPAQLMAAISERCRLAAVPEERIISERAEKHLQYRGIKI